VVKKQSGQMFKCAGSRREGGSLRLPCALKAAPVSHEQGRDANLRRAVAKWYSPDDQNENRATCA